MAITLRYAILSLLWLFMAATPDVASASALAKKPSSTQFEIPSWFKTSFLDLREDVSTAARQGKRLMVYFGQDGCPYCRELMQNNFAQKDIVDYTRKHFDAVAVNLWGDTEVTTIDGKTMSEKQLGEHLKISYTPTLLFFDEKGNTVLRLNGYYPPHRFRAALQYASGGQSKTESFRDYLARVAPPPASGKLHSEPGFLKSSAQLNKLDSKPLVVFFEQKDCSGCDTLHQKIFTLPETRAQLKRFNAIILDMWGKDSVVTPQGKVTTAREWAKELDISYAPSAVLFDQGKEVIRIEGMLKSFHVQSVLDYVASRAYIKQPNLQRYIDERATGLRASGKQLDIWQ